MEKKRNNIIWIIALIFVLLLEVPRQCEKRKIEEIRQQHIQEANQKFQQETRQKFQYRTGSGQTIEDNTVIDYSRELPLHPPELKKDWERIYIKDLGSFDLPPTMEVQQGKYKEFVDNVRKIQGFDVSQLTAQQRGLNEFDSKGYEKYARVIINTLYGNKGEYANLDFNINELKKSEINELNSMYEQEIQQIFYGTGLKVIKWYPLTIEKVNGMSSFHFSYKRQLGNEPIVTVHAYMFHNIDRMYTLSLSYRDIESNYWKSDFETILKSFRINNIKK